MLIVCTAAEFRGGYNSTLVLVFMVALGNKIGNFETTLQMHKIITLIPFDLCLFWEMTSSVATHEIATQYKNKIKITWHKMMGWITDEEQSRIWLHQKKYSNTPEWKRWSIIIDLNSIWLGKIILFRKNAY